VCSALSESPLRGDEAVQLVTSVSSARPVQRAALHPSTTADSKLLTVDAASSSVKGPSAALITSPVQTRISQPPPQSVADNGNRTIARVLLPDSDDEDEVEVIQAFCGRPTRSGRIPRPAFRPSEEITEQVTGAVEPLKSSASKDAISSTTSSATNLTAVKKSKHVVSLPQRQQSYMTSLTRCPDVTSQSPVTSATSAITPHVDLSHLPPGYFVVVEAPSSNVAGSQQPALYHIFAVDQDVTTESSMLPAANVASQQSGAVTTFDACQQRETLSNGNTLDQSVVCGRPVTAGAVRSDNSVMCSQSFDTVNARHSDATLFTGGGSSSSRHDVTQICQDLSGLANTEVTVVKQADGTLVIQSTPTTTSRLPRPRLPPTQMLQRPTAPRLVPQQTHMKLVPRIPSAQLVTRQMLPHNAEIVVDTNAGRLSEDADGAQYVDIVVEDCDDFEQEECVL